MEQRSREPGRRRHGGGFSRLFPTQSWQAGAPTGPGRLVPDVAANADPRTGYEIVFRGEVVTRRPAAYAAAIVTRNACRVSVSDMNERQVPETVATRWTARSGAVLLATCDPERPLSGGCEMPCYARLGSSAVVQGPSGERQLSVRRHSEAAIPLSASFGRPSVDVTPFRKGLGRGSCSALAKAVAPASPSLSLPVT